MLQRVQLSIDPYFNTNRHGRSSSESTSPSPSPSSSSSSSSSLIDISPATSNPPTSPESAWRLFDVLCLYEFASEDPDHLPFRKGDILEIVRQEESGWWAAFYQERIGWIPCAFVTYVSDGYSAKLRSIRRDLRVCQYEVDRIYEFAPVTAITRSATLPLRLSSVAEYREQEQSVEILPLDELGGKVSAVHYTSPSSFSAELPDDVVPSLSRGIPQSPHHPASVLDACSTNETDFESLSGPGQVGIKDTHIFYPPSPVTPMPHPIMPKIEPLRIIRRSPPTLLPSAMPTPSLSRCRSDSSPALLCTFRMSPGQPMMQNDCLSISSEVSTLKHTLQKDTALDRAPDYRQFDLALESSDEEISSPRSRRSDKVKQLTGDDDAQALHDARQAQAKLPWYLRPSYTGDMIKLDYDGSVRAGTLYALVEKLTGNPLNSTQEYVFRHTFLMTLDTFTTPIEFFNLMIEQYQLRHPPNLSEEELVDWRERKLQPVQKRVLEILSIVIDEQRLSEDSPELFGSLRRFLIGIYSQPTAALSANTLLQSLDMMSTQIEEEWHPSPTIIPTKQRKQSKSVSSKCDVSRMDAVELAQQLTVMEYRLYVDIKAKECVAWRQTRSGKAVKNLTRFSATHDKLAAWVKSSVLAHEGLAKRADTIDFWIKVAEKCRLVNNFSSMTSIVAALSSSDITRLHLTWAHVGRGANLQPMLTMSQPIGNFAAYRKLHRSVSGPCIPFIGPFLTDIVHIQDQLLDNVIFPLSSNSSPLVGSPPSGQAGDSRVLINFAKRQKLREAVDSILRFQHKKVEFSEDGNVVTYIMEQMSVSTARDDGVFWKRSHEIQQSEVAHADIRKGLEAAGF